MSGGGTLDVEGATLSYRVDGPDGAPWLVFSNSLMTDTRLWDGQVARLGDRFRILRYDQRGHGRSSVVDRDCTFLELVADLAALLRHLDVTSAALVGVSMGGITALGLAALHPERIARVAICDCQDRSSEAGRQAWEERIAVVRAGGMGALAEPTLRRWFTDAAFADRSSAIDLVRTMITATPTEGFVRATRALQDYDFSAYPARLRCPALLLSGGEDATLPETMPQMARAAPNAVFRAVSAAGHLPMLEQPDRFDAILSAFLAAGPDEVLPPGI